MSRRRSTTLNAATVIPTGELLKLRPADIRPNPNNPRVLFDPEPLKDLKENIRVHGVLVPIIVYPLPASDKYGILDGARRHRCCVELEEEGLSLEIPANVVQPPDQLAGLLYMFSIHNFREPWELMPTALSLKVVIEALDETDTKKLSRVTGLSERQVERCKILLEVPEHLQQLSLDPNPATRIPSNFWIEAHPVVQIIATDLPEVESELGRVGILEHFVEKYRAKGIKSVIHFRRIVEAVEFAEGDPDRKVAVLQRLKDYLADIQLDTRTAFDEFVLDTRQIQSALRSCETFITQLDRARVEHAIDPDRTELIEALRKVRAFVEALLDRMEGSDPPAPPVES